MSNSFRPTHVYLFAGHPFRRGAVATMVAILMVVLLGCVAMAVDIGYLYVARTELQRAADASALAGASQLPNIPYAIVEARYYATLNSPNQGQVLNHGDTIIGRWDNQTNTFSPWGQPYNAVRVVVRRSQANGNPVNMFFAGILGITHSGVSASAVALAPPSNGAFRFLIDDEMFDSDEPAIEDLADQLGLDPDEMLTGQGLYKWIYIPAGTVLELPTGQVGDEALFDCQAGFPFTASSNPSLIDFLLENNIPDELLDPLVNVEPVSDGNVYQSFVNPDATLVSPVFKSDVSALEDGVNAKGERRGLVAFQIIGIGDDPDGGGSCLPNLIIRFVSPSDIDLNEVSFGSGAIGSLQIVQGGYPYNASYPYIL